MSANQNMTREAAIAAVQQDAAASKKWADMSQEERDALYKSDYYGARGKEFGAWAGYDPSKHGGAHFDQADLDYLKSQNWMHNDILRAAGSSNYVDPSIDQALKDLNTKSTSTKKLPKSLRLKLGMSEAIFLGGDPKDPNNYKRASTEVKPVYGYQKGQRVQLNGGLVGMITAGGIAREEIKRQNKRPEAETFTWGGINADGTANGLSGTSLESRGLLKEAKTRHHTWAMPKDLADHNFADRIQDAEGKGKPKPEPEDNNDAGGGASPPPELPAHTPTIETADYGTKRFEIDTSTQRYDDFVKRRQVAASTDGTVGGHSAALSRSHFAGSDYFRERLAS